MTEDADRDLRRAESLDEELLEAESVDVESYLDDESRIDRIDEELRMGFSALAHIGKAVSIFGSARTPRDHPEYERARVAARLLGEAGFAIITGGGPGVMEAANRGAREAGVPSIGLDIELPHEQAMNEWVDLPLTFHYFFTRKVMFVRYASAFVALPAGSARSTSCSRPPRCARPARSRASRSCCSTPPTGRGSSTGSAARCSRAARSSRMTSSACASRTISARCSPSASPPTIGVHARPSYSRRSNTHWPSRRPSVRRSWPIRKMAWSSSVPGRSMTCTSSRSVGSLPRSAA